MHDQTIKVTLKYDVFNYILVLNHCYATLSTDRAGTGQELGTLELKLALNQRILDYELAWEGGYWTRNYSELIRLGVLAYSSANIPYYIFFF